MSAGFTALSLISSPSRLQYLTFVIVISWRQLLFMSLYATIHTSFRKLNHAFGRLAGLGMYHTALCVL
jgi:hypothetical protein